MRSQQSLLEASGYADRPQRLRRPAAHPRHELRLITPTDPEGKDDGGSGTRPASGQYYQLTHDYLVHSLRDWLTRKQRETRRGGRNYAWPQVTIVLERSARAALAALAAGMARHRLLHAIPLLV